MLVGVWERWLRWPEASAEARELVAAMQGV